MRASQTGGSPPARAYHHGDLRHALIAAAESLLAERGVEGFTLRECARRAGVSPAAPAHHFGNVTGLLTAIATLGFDELATGMEVALEASDGTPEGELKAIGLGYIRFALMHPARFRVVFGRFPLDKGDAAFDAASRRAFAILSQRIRPGHDPDESSSAADQARLVAAWSTVHGFANLAIDGRLPFPDLRGAPAIEALAEAVVTLMAAAARHGGPSP